MPLSCPLSAAKTGKERRTTAQSEGVERTDLVSIRPWSGKDQQGLAKRGYARFFWLRTRRSQVRETMRQRQARVMVCKAPWDV